MEEQINQTLGEEAVQEQPKPEEALKFCKHCGKQIPKDAVVCTFCGRQVEELTGGQNSQPNIVINNANSNTNSNVNTISVSPGALKREKNKWVALLL